MEDNEYGSSAFARNVLCKRSTPGTCLYLTKFACLVWQIWSFTWTDTNCFFLPLLRRRPPCFFFQRQHQNRIHSLSSISRRKLKNYFGQFRVYMRMYFENYIKTKGLLKFLTISLAICDSIEQLENAGAAFSSPRLVPRPHVSRYNSTFNLRKTSESLTVIEDGFGLRFKKIMRKSVNIHSQV